MQLAAEVQQVRATQESFPIAIAKERIGDEDLAVWVTKESPWFGVLEELEANVFFDGQPVCYAESGFDFEFLVIVGGDEGSHRVRHVMRVGLPTKVQEYEGALSFLAHDLIQSGQGVSHAGLVERYRNGGHDLAKILSVETSIRTEALTSRLRTTSLLAYYSVMQRLLEAELDGVFSHNNRPAIKSMKRVGIRIDQFVEGLVIRTPLLDGPGFDEVFEPGFIPVCSESVNSLERLVRDPPRSVPWTGESS